MSILFFCLSACIFVKYVATVFCASGLLHTETTDSTTPIFASILSTYSCKRLHVGSHKAQACNCNLDKADRTFTSNLSQCEPLLRWSSSDWYTKVLTECSLKARFRRWTSRHPTLRPSTTDNRDKCIPIWLARPFTKLLIICTSSPIINTYLRYLSASSMLPLVYFIIRMKQSILNLYKSSASNKGISL